MAESNSWSELPGELLCLIDQWLFKWKDVIRFGAVCKPWRRSLLLDRPGRFRQSLPWLMLPYCSNDVSSSCSAECERSDSCRRFYDVAERKFRHIELPEGLDKTTCRGSALGWVFTLQRTPFMFLLNPLTREQIPLPSITSFPDVLKYRPEKTGYEHLYVSNSGRKIALGKKFFESTFINKMALSADPAAEKDFVVMVIRCLGGLRLAFCRPREDEAWTLIPHQGRKPIGFMDVVFWRGQFYALDSRFRVHICDISIPNHPTLRCFIDNEHIGHGAANVYLSVSPTGDELMMVTRYRGWPMEVDDDNDDNRDGIVLPEDDEADTVGLDHDSDDEHRIDPGVNLESKVTYTTEFKVFKLKDDTKEWVEVRSIGEYALFLGFNTSSFVCTRDHPEIAPNSIYFSDDMLDYQYKKLLGGYDMGIFSLSTGRVEPLYDLRSFHSNPSFIFPYPVWFLPSNY